MLNKRRSRLGGPGLALHCLLFIVRLIWLCHMVKNWSLASEIAVGRQQKLVRVCLRVSFINECTDAARNENAREKLQERARTTPAFFPIMWFSGNEKSQHCSHALSAENWLHSNKCVKCWAGYFHSEAASMALASPAGGVFENEKRSCTQFPPARGSWDVLLVSGTISQVCQRYQKTIRWLRIGSSVARMYHSLWGAVFKWGNKGERRGFWNQAGLWVLTLYLVSGNTKVFLLVLVSAGIKLTTALLAPRRIHPRPQLGTWADPLVGSSHFSAVPAAPLAAAPLAGFTEQQRFGVHHSASPWSTVISMSSSARWGLNLPSCSYVKL